MEKVPIEKFKVLQGDPMVMLDPEPSSVKKKFEKLYPNHKLDYSKPSSMNSFRAQDYGN